MPSIAAALGEVGLPAPVSELAARTWDAVVVGGGHNGLTCAAYLARAGQSVLVLERRSGSAARARSSALRRPPLRRQPVRLRRRPARPASVVDELDLRRPRPRGLRRRPQPLGAVRGRHVAGAVDRPRPRPRPT